MGFSSRHDRPWRSFTVASVVTLAIWWTGFGWPSTGKVHAQPVRSDATADKFQLVVRVSQELFHSAEPEVDQTEPIDMIVLGVRTVGCSNTKGQLFPDFKSDGSAAAFDLVFEGKIQADTVGRPGVAVIRNQTWSDFELRVPIRIQRETGFVAGQIASHIAITRQCRTISSTLPGLRGRLVRRIARRRVDSQEALLRSISIERMRQRLHTAFQAKIDERLERWNRWFLRIQTSLRLQPWFEQLPELVVGTDEHHLLVGVDFRGRSRVPRPLPPQLPAVGTDDDAYPVDIFLGPKRFDSELEQATVGMFTAMVSQLLTEGRASRPESSAQTSSGPRLPRLARLQGLAVDVDQAGPWTVIQVRRDP